MATQKIEKALQAVKSSAVKTTYVSGAAVLPAAGMVAIYIDLLAGGTHRRVEAAGAIRKLSDAARQDNYNRDAGTTAYWRMPIGSAMSYITKTTNPLDIVSGDIAIGVNASVVTGSKGSILLDSCIEQLAQAFGDL